MIKINLLPTKRKPPKKVTELQKQLLIAALVLIPVGAGMAYWWINLDGKIALLQEQEATKKATKASQDKQLLEVKGVEGERKTVTDRIGIIEKLKKNQAGPVRILDELSKALPVGVNIGSFSESGGNISINGVAFTNDAIVLFVENLKKSAYFSDADLKETSQSAIEGFEVYAYRIQLRYKGL